MFKIKSDRGHWMMRTDVRDVLNAMMMTAQDERDAFVLIQVGVALGMYFEGSGSELTRGTAVHVLRPNPPTANVLEGSTPSPLTAAVVTWQPKGRR